MDRFVKVPTNISTPFNSRNNIVRFQLPTFGVVDLSASHLQLDVRMNAPNEADGIFILQPKFRNYNFEVPNSALVRNCMMKSGKGILQSQRRADIVSSNLNQYERSISNKLSDNFLDMNTIVNPKNSQYWTNYADINKLGTVKSEYKTFPVNIPLRDILSICEHPAIDMSKLGRNPQLEFELNLDSIVGQQLMTSDKWIGKTNQFQPENNNTGQPIEITNLTTLCKFDDLDQSPYYVGQKLKIEGKNDGTDFDKTVVITSISRNDDNSLQLTFSEKIADLANGKTLSNLVASTIDVSGAITVEFTNANVQLKYVSRKAIDVFSWVDYHVEEASAPDQQNYIGNFQIPGNAFSVMIMTLNNTPYSDLDWDHYRMSIDNVNITDDLVYHYSSLYNDLLARTLRVNGRMVNNLNSYFYKNNEYNFENTLEGQVAMLISGELEPKSGMKLLNFNYNADAQNKLNDFVIVSSIPKVLEL